MKNLLKWTAFLLVLTFLFQACEDDPVEPENTLPDPIGKWVLKSATLVDGNAGTADAEDLVVKNVLGAPELTVPVGDTQYTTGLISGFLLGAACEVPTQTSTYYLELAREMDGDNEVQIIYFACVDGTNETKTDSGNWNVVENTDGTYTITLNVSVGGTILPISFINFVLNDATTMFTGTAVGYPMVMDAEQEIGEGNIQFLTAGMEFVALP